MTIHREEAVTAFLTNMECSDEDDITIISFKVPNNNEVTEITSA